MKSIIISGALFSVTTITAQQKDTVFIKNDTTNKAHQLKISGPDYRTTDKSQRIISLILPVTLISYGFIALNNTGLLKFDTQIKEEIWTDHPHNKITIDKYLQYALAFAVYGLNAMGVKGKNNFRDRTMIYLLSNAIMGVTVQSLKAITKIQRPDGYGTNAFPSGHTATAFVAAEFLQQEYKDVSPWYGVAGYSMAIATAYLRMYNNKHWFRDLLPGAGIGMLCTKLAYWLYPAVNRKLFKNKVKNTVIMPFYQDKTAGLTIVHNFHH